jgi:hypothetical protein
MGQRSAKVTLFNKISNRSNDFLAVKEQIIENYILVAAKISATNNAHNAMECVMVFLLLPVFIINTVLGK